MAAAEMQAVVRSRAVAVRVEGLAMKGVCCVGVPFRTPSQQINGTIARRRTKAEVGRA